jgi:hypothetical protein
MIEGNEFYDHEREGLDLKEMVRTLWSYRRAMVIGIGGVIMVMIIALLAVYLYVPTERVATVGFQLTFNLAESGKYPNEATFSSADVIAPPVLSEVYRMNQLERFTDFQSFRESMYVLLASAEQGMLDSEYQTKLADIKLSPVDRARIEEEFRQKRESLKTTQLSLNFRRTERLTGMPPELTSKILHDVLAVWATQAAEKRGVLQYNIPSLTKNLLKNDYIAGDDFVIAADYLRAKVQEINKNIVDVSRLPGAQTMRTEKERLSLAEIGLSVQDLWRFKLAPLITMLHSRGLAENSRAVTVYFQDRLFQNRLLHDESLNQLKSLQDALASYMQAKGSVASPSGSGPGNRSGLGAEGTVIPQLGETFLDKLVELSNKDLTDIKFRQDILNRIIEKGSVVADLETQVVYYQSMIDDFKSPTVTRDATTQAGIKEQLEIVRSGLSHAMDGVEEIYNEVSAHNLNPPSMLYAMTSPVTIIARPALPVSQAMFYATMFLFLALVLIPIACLVHASMTNSELLVLSKSGDKKSERALSA